MRRTRTSRIRLVRKIWADCVPSSPPLSRDSCPGKSGTAFSFSLVVPVIHWPFLHFGLNAPPIASQTFVQGGPVGYVKPRPDQTGVRDSKKAVARPRPLNYQVRHEFFSFFLPHFPGAHKREGFCS